MSTRESFVSAFGEAEAAAVEAAADMHRAELVEGYEMGSDAFRDCIVIAIGFECMEQDGYRDYHGIATPWISLRQWIKDNGRLPEHDGPIDYLAMYAGAYNEFMPGKEE